MCGIIGFTGFLDAKDVLIKGLAELEYRGYDSAGISVFTDEGIKTIKSVGKVAGLQNKIPADINTSCGIGHTRWATHGGVTETNAHPHTAGAVTLIHNGIIENYTELAEKLAKMGRTPISQTDTEIAAILMDTNYHGDAYEAIKNTCAELTGAYAFCIMFADQKDVIYCIRNVSPLVACSTEEGTVVASDMVALLRYSKEYMVLPEAHIAKLTKNGITVTNLDGEVVTPQLLSVNWDMSAAQKNGFKHYMLKEIHEQPEAVLKTLTPRIKKVQDAGETYMVPDFSEDGIADEIFKDTTRVVITACGTAMHAGMIGRLLMEKLARIPVQVEVASEYRYSDPILDEHTLVIVVSQSGETADTLAALRVANEKHAHTIGIVNVKGSSIARECEKVLYTHAGPEIAVASTKAYTAQLAAFYLLAFRFAYAKKMLSLKEVSCLMEKLGEVCAKMDEVILEKDVEKELSKRLTPAQNAFFIGRGLDYALACEASIKLKEITYIHSEAYAAGELKHGTLSLVTAGVPVIALGTQQEVFQKLISNVKEVRARGAMVVLVVNKANNMPIEPEVYDVLIRLPESDDMFTPFTAAVVLQLIAYYTSSYRGLDVDQPRNLAKSVTVE